MTPDHVMTDSAMGMMGWMMMLGWAIGAVVLVVLILLAVALAIRPRRDATPEFTGSPAHEELDGRYARGEIDRDTYLLMRRDLDR